MRHITGFLNTQPLWKKDQFGLRQFEMPEIEMASFTPTPIPTNLRLGHQIEYIFKQLLDHSSAYHVLAHNIQIKKENITIGELDFILEDLQSDKNSLHKNLSSPRLESDNKPLLHVELTYKFYIIDPSISEPIHRLMGPNRKDMFFTKMEKTRDKQLPLLFSPEGKKSLATLNITANELIQETAFLGQLFIPYGVDRPSIRPLNTNCIVGFWVSFDAFNTTTFQKYTYYIPHKYEWLQAPREDVIWKNHFDTLMDINMRLINERSPMVWIRKQEGIFEKCFVVWW